MEILSSFYFLFKKKKHALKKWLLQDLGMSLHSPPPTLRTNTSVSISLLKILLRFYIT